MDAKKQRQAKNAANWRKRHPEKNKEVWKNANLKARTAYASLKSALIQSRNGCQICGYKDFSCLPVFEFHHKERNKEINLSAYRKTVNRANFSTEAEKCIVLCANCHRKIHHGIITAITQAT